MSKHKLESQAWQPTDKEVIVRQLSFSAWIVMIRSPNAEVWYDACILPSKKKAIKYVDKSPHVPKGLEYTIAEYPAYLDRCRTIQ